MILETGLKLDRLEKVLASIRDTAREADIKIVCGDTKVVRAGEADQIYLNTAGIGVYSRDPLQMSAVRPGDRIVLSGMIGNHTVHLLSIREGLGFETRVLSDCAPLSGMIDGLFSKVPSGAIRSMRDVTRGGLSAVLHEYAGKVGRSIVIEERLLPIQHETAMAADMLGINPLHCANEGCVAIFVDPAEESELIAALQAHKYGTNAVTIGEVTEREEGLVIMRDTSGREHILEELRGAELPRLC
jgi:hydrogenase expression/formation protein HypE